MKNDFQCLDIEENASNLNIFKFLTGALLTHNNYYYI